MKEIFVKDIYLKLYEKLQMISEKYNLNFAELHEIYLKDLSNQF